MSKIEQRTSHRVSIKVAIYSPDGKSVLATNIPSIGRYGIPGGHLDAEEEPLEALKRELLEELAIDDAYDFKLKDSWWHEERSIEGIRKLVLGYVAKRDKLELPPAPHPNDEFGEWLEIESLTEEKIGSYCGFIKQFKPV